MKMKYRGNQYKSETSVLEMKESDIIGKYRGSEWSYKLPKHIPQLQPKLFLTYRGTSYSTCPNAIPLMMETKTPITTSHLVTTVAECNLEQVHLSNLRRNLERRIKVAQENHNDYLLEMLKQESQQLAVN
ncbi:MAG: DUF4278 domain-containing protein [Cyanobacteria bacterium]|nr:DUF4278 domain-containing protein [Cyanobacteria bacterium CG_2015-16_32_12]NCO78671.1 DUF4278 domain-containing protein [Cyanobacteria bacterium CG_2015-22_32_23]NCQ05444.1 DUF4278 domain-containing protein [Cyanobacteria bacterium CG_2015-09_32_10]NCQ42990.1 DUF4278 domain-containing protein [Cyanobacteria bacterium CG_2015-04_32_10]NCS83330.1 DUF4278 domain-containing protein [Cyanobacteria bacterium CG_2015-02_32_10]